MTLISHSKWISTISLLNANGSLYPIKRRGKRNTAIVQKLKVLASKLATFALARITPNLHLTYTRQGRNKSANGLWRTKNSASSGEQCIVILMLL